MNWIENAPVVVVVARFFNPSIITPVWLTKVGILNANGEYQPESIFSGQIIQAVTDEFVLVVTEEQLQFIVRVEPDKQSALINSKVGALIKKLPEVPYNAVGLNFSWHLIPNAGLTPSITRQLFAGRNDGLFSRFAELDARFGAYLSKDFGSFRMKLDMKPVQLEKDGQKEERIQFSFNFHADLSKEDNVPDSLIEVLHKWNDVRTEVLETIKTVGFKE